MDEEKNNHISNKSGKISVVIIARNEEKFIEKTLSSLLTQELVPHRIIVVNDGSTDKTKEIVSKIKNVELINREKREESFVAKKELAEVLNSGLAHLQNEKDCEFIMISGADLLYPKNYLSEIVERMRTNPSIVISSGVIEGEFSIEPRGSGRIVRYDFWKKLGLQYPVNYGFEAYLLLKAKSMGYEIVSYQDLIVKTQRKTGSEYNPELYFYYGLGLKALGYTFPYVLVRSLLFAKNKPKAALQLIKGFLSKYDNLYEPELRKYVRDSQYHKIVHLDSDYVKRFKGKLHN